MERALTGCGYGSRGLSGEASGHTLTYKHHALLEASPTHCFLQVYLLHEISLQ